MADDQNSRKESGRFNGDAARADSDREIDRLFPVVYEELRTLAEAVLNRGVFMDPTRTTSLVNDAYIRLARRGLRFNDQGHFLAMAAKAMRFLLIDRARRNGRAKRGGGGRPQSLEDDVIPAADGPEFLAVHEALEKLAALDPTKAQLVELRYFGGLTLEEASNIAGISPATAKREWASAKAWLFRELSDQTPDPSADADAGNF